MLPLHLRVELVNLLADELPFRFSPRKGGQGLHDRAGIRCRWFPAGGCGTDVCQGPDLDTTRLYKRRIGARRAIQP